MSLQFDYDSEQDVPCTHETQMYQLRVEIRSLKDDVEELSSVISKLTESLSEINRSMDRYKGILGGISFTLTCVWAFFTFAYDHIKGN